MVFRPHRGHGVTIGVIVTIWALAFGVGLVARAAGADITTGTLLLYLAGGILLLVGLAFAYWTYACAGLAYVLDDRGVIVRWGIEQVILPFSAIEVVAAAPSPEGVSGLNWPGYHVGKTVLQGRATASVFATEFPNQEAVYIRAGKVILALSPAEPDAFIAEVERRKGSGPRSVPEQQKRLVELGVFLSDRAALAFLVLAALLNAGLFAILFVRYQDLPATFRVDFPVGGAVNVIERSDLFTMPLTGLAILAVNVVGAVLLHRRQRALAQTVLGATLFLQVTLTFAMVSAVS